MVAALLATERITRGAQNRGYWHVAKWLGAGVREGEVVVAVGRARIQFPLSDPYWTRLVAVGYDYEPEVAKVLGSILGDNSDFIDVGANIGYWSVWVSQNFPSTRVLAVEPNPAVYQQLVVNNTLNGNRFETVSVAVALDGQDSVAFQVPSGRGGHAAAHVRAAHEDLGDATVVHTQSRSLDELLAGFRKLGREVLIKLDIEGLEADVLASSAEISGPGIAVLYEDHGADPTCPPTSYLLSDEDRATYFLAPDGGVVELSSVDQLASLKRRPKVGYNCLSVVRGSRWHIDLQPLVASPQDRPPR